jgi:hypothetical protein
MGVNNPGQQPQVLPRNGASQGVSQGASQLAQALLAKQAMQQYRQRLGIPGYGVPGTQPGAVTPNAMPGGAPPLTAGGPAVMGAQPQLPGMPAPNPQANAVPLAQVTPGLTPQQ